MELSVHHKLLYLFINSKCSSIGLWTPNPILIDFFMKEPIDFESFQEKMEKDGKIEIFENGDWWLLEFINFQYGFLRETTKAPIRLGYIDKLKNEGLWEKYNLTVTRKNPESKIMTQDKTDTEVHKHTSEEYSDRFKEFWDKYPEREGKKYGKHSAWKFFKEFSESDQIQVIKNAVYYGIGNKYTKDAHRFLENDFWRDYAPKEGRKFSPSAYVKNRADISHGTQSLKKDEKGRSPNVNYGTQFDKEDKEDEE